jgi:trk system potassium uptake protein TrkH
MILSGVNFTMHYRLWVERRPASVFRDTEVRAYLAIMAVCTSLIGLTLFGGGGHSGEGSFRTALFQVVSVMTTTGYITADYEQWLPANQILLLMLMFVGGCTGSTAGGLKITRVLLLVKIIHREFRRMVHRHGVFAIRLSDRVVPDSAVQGLLSMVYLSLTINFAACLIIASTGVDVLTTITAVASCMFNVGPGLGVVGPTEHYGHLPALAKWALSFCMIAGRLEFYTVLVIFMPEFWKR